MTTAANAGAGKVTRVSIQNPSIDAQLKPLTDRLATKDWARKQLQRIGLYGTLNSVHQSLATTRAAIANGLGDTAKLSPMPDLDAEQSSSQPVSGGENVTPEEIARMAENLPIGSSVNVEINHAPPEQPAPSRVVPNSASQGGTGMSRAALATVALSLLTGGLGGGYGLSQYFNSRNQQPAAREVTPLVVDGTLEWETPGVQIEKRLETTISGEQSSATDRGQQEGRPTVD